MQTRNNHPPSTLFQDSPKRSSRATPSHLGLNSASSTANPLVATPPKCSSFPAAGVLESPCPSSSAPSTHNGPSAGELWSVARLAALERSATEQQMPHHPHLPHLNSGGFYQGVENLTVNKGSSGNSIPQPLLSPPLYSPHSSAIQKPVATFYRHELAKQFHLYRSHHSHLQQGETPPASSQSSGVM